MGLDRPSRCTHDMGSMAETKLNPKARTIKRGVAWDADLLPRLLKLARGRTFSRLVNDLCRKQIDRKAA